MHQTKAACVDSIPKRFLKLLISKLYILFFCQSSYNVCHHNLEQIHKQDCFPAAKTMTVSLPFLFQESREINTDPAPFPNCLLSNPFKNIKHSPHYLLLHNCCPLISWSFSSALIASWERKLRNQRIVPFAFGSTKLFNMFIRLLELVSSFEKYT